MGVVFTKPHKRHENDDLSNLISPTPSALCSHSKQHVAQGEFSQMKVFVFYETVWSNMSAFMDFFSCWSKWLLQLLLS